MAPGGSEYNQNIPQQRSGALFLEHRTRCGPVDLHEGIPGCGLLAAVPLGRWVHVQFTWSHCNSCIGDLSHFRDKILQDLKEEELLLAHSRHSPAWYPSYSNRSWSRCIRSRGRKNSACFLPLIHSRTPAHEMASPTWAGLNLETHPPAHSEARL